MKNHEKLREILLLTFFIIVQIILTISPFGFIYLGGISITIVHIPVIVGACLFGPKKGALLGFVFGFMSLLKASFTPDISAFMFSPFVSIAGRQGNWSSLLVCFLPRILLGISAGYLYRFPFLHKTIVAILTGLFASLLHSILVLGLIYLFFAPAYAALLQIDSRAVIQALCAVLSINGLAEAALAALMTPLLLSSLQILYQKKRDH